MHIVNKSAGSMSNQSSTTKSSVTCSVCNGSCHYARNCPSRAKSGGGSSVRVNMAVVKVTRRIITSIFPIPSVILGNVQPATKVRTITCAPSRLVKLNGLPIVWNLAPNSWPYLQGNGENLLRGLRPVISALVGSIRVMHASLGRNQRAT